MKYNNYLNYLAKAYDIEINKEIRNTMEEYFGNSLNVHTEQELYESSEKIIQINTVKHLREMYYTYKKLSK